MPNWLIIPIIRLCIFLFVVEPVSEVAELAIEQVAVFSDDLRSYIGSESINQNTIIDAINNQLRRIPIIDYQVDAATVQAELTKVVERFASQLSSTLIFLGEGLATVIINVILYIVITSSLIHNRRRVGEYIADILPMKKDTIELYRTHLVGMGASMIGGTIVIAAVQALMTGISIALVGVPYAVLWTILAFFVSLFPIIGSPLVAMPIALVVFLTGNIWGALFIIAVNIAATNIVDTYLRVKLVKKDAKINETLLLISVYGAIPFFGLPGIIYGPMMMSFALVTFEAYRKNRKHFYHQ